METRVEPQEVGRAGKDSPPQHPKASQKRNQLSDSPCGPLFLLTRSRTREEACTSAELDNGLSSVVPRRAPLPQQGSRQQGWQQQEEGVPAWPGVDPGHTPAPLLQGCKHTGRSSKCACLLRAWGSTGEPHVPVEKNPPSAWRAAARWAAGDGSPKPVQRQTRTEVSAGPGRSDLTAGDACSGPLGGAG